MKKIIVNGACSMLGINLIEYAIKENTEVIAIVRENSSKIGLLPQSNLIKVVECNLENICKLELEKSDYDAFYHFAWAGTTGEDRNNMHLQNHNVEYTLDSIEFAKRVGCRRFIGAGSQAENGRVEGKINPNTPVNPENGYGIAKLTAGLMGKLLAEKLNIEFIWTRILSVYGKYNNENTMIMASIKNMLSRKEMKYTKAEQVWDYLYAEDAAKALYLIGEKGMNGKVYCIGSGTAKPLHEYITEMKDYIDPNIELKFGEIEYSKNQVMNLVADITSLTEDTGFVPEIDFKEGIKRTIDWYKGEYGKNEEN